MITLAQSIAPVGAIVASLMGGAIADSIGWQYMCVIVGVMGIVDAVFLILLLPSNTN